jgi:hypothetical protein
MHYFFLSTSLNICELCLVWLALAVKQWQGHCPWLLLQHHGHVLLLQLLLSLAALQCISGITVAPGHCPRHTRFDWGGFCELRFNFHEKMSALQILFE